MHYRDLDENQKANAIEIFSMKHLLQLSIISDNYSAEPAMIQAISYTQTGDNEIKQIVKRNPKLDPSTVRLLAFLEFESNEGLYVDPIKTDLNVLRRAISESIKAKRIMFPWIYGRETVDTLVSLFGVNPALTAKESSRLLKASDIGVFQIGSTIVGPFGCLESPEFRILKPTKELRGFIEVRGLERVNRKFQLTTSRAAKVNSASKLDDKAKEKLGLRRKSASQNLIGLLKDYMKSELKPLHQSDQIFRLLGETLTFDEAKSVLLQVLPEIFKRQGGAKALEKQTARIFGEAEKFVSTLTRPEVHQLLHLATNQELYWAVERAVKLGEIEFVDNLSRFTSTPKAAARLELSKLGLRNDSGAADGLFATNIMDLLHQIFVFSGLKSVQDLSYVLDSDTRDLDLLIREMVSVWSPSKIVEYIASEREMAVFAGKYLGLEEANALTVRDLKEKIAYKLGLQELSQVSILERIEVNVSELQNISIADTTSILNTFRQIFEDVETSSKDILVFTWWALLKTRNRDSSAFAYNHSEARNDGGYIKFFSGSEKDAEMPTLAKLSSAFGALATDLKNLERVPFETDFATAMAEVESRPVVLRFKSMFHNLNVSSQERVLESLQSIGKLLLSLSPIRNPASHGNRVADPTAVDVSTTSNILKDYLAIARDTGLFPELWQFSSRTLQSTGFVTTTYSYRDRQLSLKAPTRAFVHGLPRGGKELYFLPGCELEYVGPLSFSRKIIKPDASYWTNFPPELLIEEFSSSMSSDSADLTHVDVA